MLINDAKWLYRFLDIATLVSGWSKDPSTAVGAVIVDHNRRIISTGFNGFPYEVEDNEERYNNRPLKYQMIMHAEPNAILSAARDLSTCLLIVTHEPCVRCTSLIIQSGIRQLAFKNPQNAEILTREPWASERVAAKAMLSEARVATRHL